MTDEEYYDYCKTGFSFFTSFILFPAVSLILMVFGYTKISIIIIEMIVLCLSIISFIRRLWFLRKHRRYITDKQFYFQNLSYVICLLISIIAGFFVKLTVEDGKNVLNGFFLNIYIIPIVIIYEFVVLLHMCSYFLGKDPIICKDKKYLVSGYTLELGGITYYVECFLVLIWL